jgi:hypothetical protein
MPTPRTWLPRIDEILAILRASDVESFDRTAIEKLFEIQRRTALLLMSATGSENTGRFHIVRKADLIRYVENINQTEAQEISRRSHTLAKIDHDAEQWRSVREHIYREDKDPVRFTVTDEIASASFSSLPAGVEIEPGSILVKFNPEIPEEACQKLFALGKALVNDFGSFLRIMQNKAVSNETALEDILAGLEYDRDAYLMPK